jgi:hypothetical protein
METCAVAGDFIHARNAFLPSSPIGQTGVIGNCQVALLGMTSATNHDATTDRDHMYDLLVFEAANHVDRCLRCPGNMLIEMTGCFFGGRSRPYRMGQHADVRQ